MRDVAVIVPYRSGEPWRDSAWTQVVRPAWEALEPGALIVGEAPPGAHPGEFNHPKAINDAASMAPASCEHLIVADADCAWTPGLPANLIHAARYSAPWALPERYATLTRSQTKRVMRGAAELSPRLLTAASWVGRSWAGLVAVSIDNFWQTGGYDERYTHWGADDMAFGLTADTLLGPHARADGAVLHLWHPTPLDHNYGHERHREQYALGERYKAAVGDPVAMRAVRFDGRLGR